MRRWPTWLLVGALVALGSVAVADALRGGGTEVAPRPGTTGTVALTPRNESVASAMSGVLYYSNAEDECRLAGQILPDLRVAPPPKLRSCRFSLSSDGANALPGEAVWQPQGGLYAREKEDGIEIGSPSSGETMHVVGASPAFKPDGTFTYVRDHKIVQWTTDCPRGAGLFTLTGDNATARCRSVALAQRAISRDASVVGLAWLGPTRTVALLGGEIDPVGNAELAVVIDGERLVAGPLRFSGPGHRIEVSPRGGYYTLWLRDELLAVRDRNGRAVVFPDLPRVRAVTWSPDERWTAAATRHSVFVFPTNEGEAPVRRLPITARDLAWR
jgi:hypothetical protein